MRPGSLARIWSLREVLRGKHTGRLLYWQYGPGKANENIDPHLAAGFADPGELEPERHPD
jgi:hypothetical protein